MNITNLIKCNREIHRVLDCWWDLKLTKSDMLCCDEKSNSYNETETRFIFGIKAEVWNGRQCTKSVTFLQNKIDE